MSPVRVLLVDDHQVVREGLQRMLELDEGIQVVGQAASGEEALVKGQELSPDVILMDIKMPGIGGIEAIRQLKGNQPALNIIVLTAYGDQYLAEAIEVGAVGYLVKDASYEELNRAIRAARQGQSPLAPSVARTLFARYAALAKEKTAYRSDLSGRQLEILRLIADGATNKEIAAQLFLSYATVKREISSIFAKLEVESRSKAVFEAYKRKLV